MEKETMNSKSTILLIVSFSCLFLQTNAVSISIAPLARIYNLCKTTAAPDLCVKTVPAHFKGQFDVYKVLDAEIKATKEKVLSTAKLIDTLIANPKNSESMASSLKICKMMYESMMDSISQTRPQVIAKDAYEVRFQFSAVISYLSTCDDAFDEKDPSPFPAESKMVFDIAGNCLDIAAAIMNRELNRVKRRFGGHLPPPPPSPPMAPYIPNPCYGTGIPASACHYVPLIPVPVGKRIPD